MATDNNQFLWVDGDTVLSNGKRYRIQGYDAREVGKKLGGEYRAGEVAGLEQADYISRVQREGGFNFLEDTGEVDDYGRHIARLKDDKGNDFTESLYRAGAVQVDPTTSQQDYNAKVEGDLERELRGEQKEFSLEDFDRDFGLRFKAKNLNEQERSGILHALQAQGMSRQDAEIYLNDRYQGVEFRHSDRDINNMARGIGIGPAWEAGWENIRGGLGGAADLLGELSGWESLEGLGEGAVRRAEYEAAGLPEYVADYKQVEGVWTGLQFVLNNAVTSAPYMAILLGSSALGGAGAAVGTGVVGLTHAGNTWNEIEGPKGTKEAVASLAAGAAMSALERLGLQSIMKPQALLTDKGAAIATKHLAQRLARQNGTKVTRELYNQAARRVADVSRSTSSGLLRELASVDASHLARLNIAQQAAKQGAAGFAGEALTEASQEALQGLTAQSFNEGGLGALDAGEFTDRLINATLAGGAIGGGLGAVGGVRRGVESHIIKSDLEGQKLDKLDAIERLRQEHLIGGAVDDPNNTADRSVEDNIRATKGKTIAREPQGSVARLAKEHETSNRGAWNVFKNSTQSLPDAVDAIFGGASRFFRAAEKTAVPIEKAVQSPILRDILSRVGQTAYSTYHAGANHQQYADREFGAIKAIVDERQIMKDFGKSTAIPSRKDYKEISALLRDFGESGAYQQYQTMAASGYTQQEIIDALPEKYKKLPQSELEALVSAARQLDDAYKAIEVNQRKIYAESNPGEVFEADAGRWYKSAAFDPVKVKNNPDAFKRFLRKHYKHDDGGALLTNEIDDIYESIVGGRSLDSSARDFSYINGATITPWSLRKGVRDLQNQPEYKDFVEDDIFASLDKEARDISRHMSVNKYFGAGGKDLDQLFNELQQEGVLSPDEVARTAWHVKAMIDSSHGNYARIQNPKWEAFQRFATTWSALGGLPLAAMSSLPETAMITYATKDNAEFKQALNHVFDQFKDMVTSAVNAEDQKLRKLGLGSDVISVSTRLATGDTNPAMAWWTDTFYRTTLIKGITDLQRRSNAAMASDFIGNALDDLKLAPRKEDGTVDFSNLNQIQLDSFNKLSNLGMDVQGLLEMWEAADIEQRQILLDTTEQAEFEAVSDLAKDFDPTVTDRQKAFADLARKEGFTDKEAIQAIRDFFNEQMDIGTYKFVNERVQNPQSANRPLIFQDPHFALLLQFNGFISTFTATVMPRLWGNYIKDGAPRARYKAAEMVIMMMVLGGLSQWLKDIIKFGKPSPYIDGTGYIQRAIYASGAIGQYERFADIAVPLYPQRHDNAIDWTFNTLIGETGPTARNIGNVAGGAIDIASGDTEGGARSILKSTPLVGPFTGGRNAVVDLLHGRVPKILPEE